ncbi:MULTISPECIES: DinB family protein [unclassified Mucilaginibacter]|uniref:DinB family protein n=1 Tax=unclassified Mucilaginibacter TaxID=2617802 RepID=UPI000965665C|nr:MULTISPECIES: DinB family protein [unclassified Mucilaginibacter]OJW12796.1 MAG: metal-dependent hydrolase [Mucilaginibacter sp. 44-25]PLW90673.1 MAG: DinB family protein [Mucilaginibacter sp.]PMP65435.1 MAG: DinB family protein [Mucilaginibacter sp.]HEK21530.1 DinB family protein [Bacteroidota bacterium]
MGTDHLPEVWLRGPLRNIPALLQPVAHALLQAREELNELIKDFPDAWLWKRVAGMASPAFHLQHLTGVLDRLFTYARNQQLDEAQLNYLAEEGKLTNKIYTVKYLTERFNTQVDAAIRQLVVTEETELIAFRGVGRKQLPSTVIGLYTHAAEHTMRHLGQLIVTVKVLQANVLVVTD